MARKPLWPPPLRTHATGQAFVRWKGKNYYLGKAGTPESLEAYERLKARLAAGSDPKPRDTPEGLTVAGAVAAWLEHLHQNYDPRGRTAEVAMSAVRPLLRLFGGSAVAEFGARQLEEVQAAMVSGCWLTPAERADLERRGFPTRWAASHVNSKLGRIRTCWRWLEKRGMVPRGSHGNLSTVDAIRAGRRDVRRTQRRKPVSRADLDAVLPEIQRRYRRRPVAAMLELQWLAGMRSCEVRLMRGQDIDRAGPVVDGVRIWLYRVGEDANKTAHLGQQRVVALGPACQAVLAPWLAAAGDAWVFPVRAGGHPYGRHEYARSVRKAGQRAGVVIAPYATRHAAATRIRAELGEDACRAFLGHRNIDTTALYGTVDVETAARAAARLA
jgi:integrase